MPYVIVSTVAMLSNLYKNAPLIVGDKDSDPDLMRYLGARLTTNYPACGSPPMYVMHAPPRVVFDNLEKRGYCLMAAQTIQEHAVWVLARPRVPEDDKTEIQRGGPNDKGIQANLEELNKTKENESSKSSKEGEKTTETSKKKGEAEKPASTKTTKTVARTDIFTQSEIELSSSKFDYLQNKTMLPRDSSNLNFGLKRGKSISDLSSSDQAKTIIQARERALADLSMTRCGAKFGVVRDSPGDLLLLDGFTQTGYGDILRPNNIPKLPKVIISEHESEPDCGKTSITSFIKLVSEPQEEPNIRPSKPCDVPVSSLLEENPIFANIPDRSHLGCLTQCEGCCCEE